MVYSNVLLAMGLVPLASAACSREMLEAATAAYVKAQTNGLPKMSTLASNITYAENNVTMPITTGVLAQPITIDFNRSLHDTTQCATFTELTAATNKHPYVIATRMLFTDSKITSIESLVADDGDWVFNATNHLKWTQQEHWDVIPESKRDSRAVIQAAGDAYLDNWGDSTVKVPYGTPCARLEGGSYTASSVDGKTNTCTMGQFPVAFKVGNRRYVIDETVGGVDIFNDFPFIEATKPEGTPSGNFIRVENGGIRYIHEDTICATKNCGR